MNKNLKIRWRLRFLPLISHEHFLFEAMIELYQTAPVVFRQDRELAYRDNEKYQPPDSVLLWVEQGWTEGRE